MNQYKYRDSIYSVVNCTIEDIPSHIERVLPYWKPNNVDVDKQRTVLEQAVNEGTAFKVVDTDGNTKAVIYYIKFKVNSGTSNLLWFEDKRMLAILCYYLRLKANMLYLYFMPHSKNYIPFEFIVQDSSIRLFHSHNQPLKINLYSRKSHRLYEEHFLAKDIQVL
jgi:hypothetical protein